MFPRMGTRTVPFRNIALNVAALTIFALIVVLFIDAPSFIAAQSGAQPAHGLILEARAAGAKGDWERAVLIYQQAVRLAPRDVSLRVELGAALANSSRLTDAIASYEEALRISPRNLAADLGLAQAYRGVHNYEETRRVLERACREHPKSAAPLAALGDLEIELQTFEAAIGHLRAAVALDPANTATRNYLAAAYQAKGDQDSALAQISKVLASDPQNALAYFQRAEIYSARNEDSRALPDAEKASALQPQNPRPRALLGKILLRTADGAPAEETVAACSGAVAALQPLLATKANDSETLFLLARAYRCAGQQAEAQKTLADFEAASQRDRATRQDQHEAEHLVEQADNLAIKNDLNGALDLLQQAIAKDPGFSPAYSLFAKLYYSAGDLEKASEAISKALEISPYVPDFLYVQGKIFEREGKPEEALADFERTVLVNPKEADAYFEMGVVYEQRKDRARALAAYKKAAELSPEDADYRRAVERLSGAASKP
jgi:tetratricopeptide (TPR) repeat protein